MDFTWTQHKLWYLKIRWQEKQHTGRMFVMPRQVESADWCMIIGAPILTPRCALLSQVYTQWPLCADLSPSFLCLDSRLNSSLTRFFLWSGKSPPCRGPEGIWANEACLPGSEHSNHSSWQRTERAQTSSKLFLADDSWSSSPFSCRLKWGWRSSFASERPQSFHWEGSQAPQLVQFSSCRTFL